MNTAELKGIIDDIIRDTFDVIKKVYAFQKESGSINEQINPSEIGSRILFPEYSKKRKSPEKDRISEQELRFIFVEQLNKVAEKKDLYYSVETPTEEAYVFSKDKGGPKIVMETDEDGVSARTDLVIHIKEDNQFIRKALIEFKALNPTIENYQKDFCKLENEGEDDTLKYFIQIIKKYDEGTIGSLKEKIASKKSGIIYQCYCLESGKDITDKITK